MLTICNSGAELRRRRERWECCNEPEQGPLMVYRAYGLTLEEATQRVEFNASARAKKLLVSHGIIQGDEQLAGVEKVLGAAVWTYMAAAVSASQSAVLGAL